MNFQWLKPKLTEYYMDSTLPIKCGVHFVSQVCDMNFTNDTENDIANTSLIVAYNSSFGYTKIGVAGKRTISGHTGILGDVSVFVLCR